MRALSTIRPSAAWRRQAAALVLGAHAAACWSAETPRDLTALPLEQLLTIEVFSASKFVQNTSEAPSLVTVITGAEIADYGWRTLADVARSVRGLYVGYDRNYSYLGARGFLRPGDYNTRFLLLVDGNRVNDAVYDQAPLGAEFPLDVSLIERIEFVPGPGSSIYGSNAFFGVINVITKKAGELAGTRLGLEDGSAGARAASASHGWRSADGAEFVLAASARRSAGRDLYFPEFDTPEQHGGVAHALDYERGERVMASAAGGPLSLTAMYARRLKGVPTASFYQPFDDPRSRTTDRQSYLNAAFHARGAAGEEWAARLFWGSYDSFGDYVNDDAARTLDHDGSASRWWGAELSVLSSRFAGHTLLAGLDYQHDYRLQQYTFDVAPYYSFLDDRRSGSRAGIYVQDELALTPRARLNLGLRYDRNSGAAGVVSPRAALIYSVSAATTLKAIYGSAFRSPNAYERYYAFPGEGGQLPNPDLARETIRSGELALVHQLGERARLSATVFDNLVAGLITQTVSAQVPETRFENDADVHARGMEIEFERRWLGGPSLRTSYSFTRVTDARGVTQVNAPAHLAKLNVATPLGFGGWRAAFEAQYVGARTSAAGAAPAYTVANLHFTSARVTGNIEAALGIYNLFGKRYADPGSVEHRERAIEQDGRTLQLRVGYAF